MEDVLKFEAQIKSAGGGGAYVDVPVDVTGFFGQRGIIKVHATFDEHYYRGALAPMERGKHFIGIRKDIQEAIGKHPGDFVCVTLRKDLEPRLIDIPTDFQTALDENPEALEKFSKMGFTLKKEYVFSILEAKKPATRERRILKAIESILNSGKK